MKTVKVFFVDGDYRTFSSGDYEFYYGVTLFTLTSTDKAEKITIPFSSIKKIVEEVKK